MIGCGGDGGNGAPSRSCKAVEDANLLSSLSYVRATPDDKFGLAVERTADSIHVYGALEEDVSLVSLGFDPCADLSGFVGLEFELEGSLLDSYPNLMAFTCGTTCEISSVGLDTDAPRQHYRWSEFRAGEAPARDFDDVLDLTLGISKPAKSSSAAINFTIRRPRLF